MKIIISHDVDHLYPSDHFYDLVFPKLWIRSSIHLLQKKISLQSWFFRIISIFQERLNRIPELAQFDKDNDIPSIFFFGMDNILGMSYKKEKAIQWIAYLKKIDLDVGVHGVNFNDFERIKSEYLDFKKISNSDSFGIRMHYVRYNDKTFKYLASAGYLFDSTDFNKEKIDIKAPYKIGNMWEFPLHIMDAYILNEGIVKAKEKTILCIETAKMQCLPYLTILFHDTYFDQKTYPIFKEWYIWLISYLKLKNYEFISYRKAIEELEKNKLDHA